ncbi:MAG TPA: chromate efflux transporter, partial [Burkholderiaceae bacterium]
IAAGVLVWLVRIKPRPGATAMSLAPLQLPFLAMSGADGNLLWQVTLFFAKAGAFVFGSGLAVVPFLYGGIVTDTHWLNDKQFVDAVAVAMITPGPVVITTGFIGYLIAGLPGAVAAAGAVFLPCYLITVIAAPHFKKYGKRPAILAFVDGITAAAVGAIAGSVVVLATRSITDVPTALLAIVTTVLLWRFKKIPEPVIVAAAALIGLALYPLAHAHP